MHACHRLNGKSAPLPRRHGNWMPHTWTPHDRTPQTLVFRDKDHRDEDYFVRNGQGLDTAMRVWGYRIDNVYNQAYQVLGSKKSSKADEGATGVSAPGMGRGRGPGAQGTSKVVCMGVPEASDARRAARRQALS